MKWRSSFTWTTQTDGVALKAHAAAGGHVVLIRPRGLLSCGGCRTIW